MRLRRGNWRQLTKNPKQGDPKIEKKKILWPTDFSENAKQAFSYVTSLGEKYQTDIHVLYVIEELSYHESSQAVLYLRALADTCVFFKKEIDVTSIEEILKAAIEAEKVTIIFFLGIKEAVPENLGKNRVDAIIKEEMEHIRLLSTAILVKQKYL